MHEGAVISSQSRQRQSLTKFHFHVFFHLPLIVDVPEQVPGESNWHIRYKFIWKESD